jgi:hypothetical protein
MGIGCLGLHGLGGVTELSGVHLGLNAPDNDEGAPSLHLGVLVSFFDGAEHGIRICVSLVAFIR